MENCQERVYQSCVFRSWIFTVVLVVAPLEERDLESDHPFASLPTI